MKKVEEASIGDHTISKKEELLRETLVEILQMPSVDPSNHEESSRLNMEESRKLRYQIIVTYFM